MILPRFDQFGLGANYSKLKIAAPQACCTSKMSQFLALERPHPAHVECQTHQGPLARYFVEST